MLGERRIAVLGRRSKPRGDGQQFAANQSGWAIDDLSINTMSRRTLPQLVLIGTAVLGRGITGLGCGLAARAEDVASVLDSSADSVNQCIADQTVAELAKGHGTGQIRAVLRDKCRAQAEQFRTTLLHGLEKEGVLDKKMRRVIDQLILALRHQSVAAYAEMLRNLNAQPPVPASTNMKSAQSMSHVGFSTG